jgi:phenylacetate-coenzyme A ligase PaaK-like adenylate-forming protein
MGIAFAFGDLEAARREHDYAARKVPFFRDRAASGAHNGDFGALPFTTKADYRAHFPVGVVADGYAPAGALVQRLQSSGTEGDRLVTVAHEFLLAERMWRALDANRDMRPLLAAAKIRTCRYAAPNCSDVECSNPNAAMKDRLLPDGTLVLPVYHDLLTTPEAMIRAAVAEIADYDPNLLYVDPTHLAFLIRSARALGIADMIPPGASIILSYSFATRLALRDIEAAAGPGTPCAAAVAMSEFGYVGIECHEGTLHLNDVDYYLELLPLDDRSGGGEPLMELAVTSVGDKLCPHVRYLTGDLYRLAPPCRCGNSMPAVILEGRKKDSLVLGDGGMITPRALDRCVGAPPWMHVYQLCVLGADRYVFRFIGEPSADEADLAALADRLKHLLRTSRLRVERTHYLPSARGGKFATVRLPN